MAELIDPYRELGLAPEAAAEPELVRAAFKALAKKYHPDAHPDAHGKARAEEKMRRLNEAQRLILSGEYRPPCPEPNRLVEVQPSPQTQARPRPIPPKPIARKAGAASMTPVYIAGLVLFLCLGAPSWFGRDHLAEAGKFAEKGQLTQALEEADKAVLDDPRDGQAYLFRARLWKKLGKPDRAEIDLANARSLVSKPDYEQTLLELSATPSPVPESTASPKGPR